MVLEHVAIWTDRLEILREFYTRYFDGVSNEKYINPTTLFESYFISFEGGARIEIMSRPDIPENANDTIDKQHRGIIHLAFEVKTMAEVDKRAKILTEAGYKILRGPRRTGDNYYEFETLDPDNNRLEVMSKYVD